MRTVDPLAVVVRDGTAAAQPGHSGELPAQLFSGGRHFAASLAKRRGETQAKAVRVGNHKIAQAVIAVGDVVHDMDTAFATTVVHGVSVIDHDANVDGYAAG